MQCSGVLEFPAVPYLNPEPKAHNMCWGLGSCTRFLSFVVRVLRVSRSIGF